MKKINSLSFASCFASRSFNEGWSFGPCTCAEASVHEGGPPLIVLQLNDY
jgi:hypothetical protein